MKFIYLFFLKFEKFIVSIQMIIWASNIWISFGYQMPATIRKQEYLNAQVGSTKCPVIWENPTYRGADNVFIYQPILCNYIHRLFLNFAESQKRVLFRCSYLTKIPGSGQTPRQTSIRRVFPDDVTNLNISQKHFDKTFWQIVPKHWKCLVGSWKLSHKFY